MKKEFNGGDEMRDEYNIESLNPRKNPYTKLLKKTGDY